MRLHRLAKLVSRGLRVMWRDEPTQHDIEALDANIRRVGLVIRLRWILVFVLTLFSVTAAGLYTRMVPLAGLWHDHLAVPAAALVFVLAYNAFYQATYRRLGNIAVLNHAQLIFDILVVGVLVYYSGGVYSWFYVMFLLFILEGAFILPRTRDVWILAGFSALVYGGILGAEYLEWAPHVAVPFVLNELHENGVYAGVRVLWVLTVIAGTASVSSFLMAVVRGRERRLAESAIIDEGTGLCNRAHFLRMLRAEVGRARRTGSAVGVILLDVNGFARFNDAFGYEAGNRVLKALADEISATVAEGPDEEIDLVTAYRYGGEEFAMIVSGALPGGRAGAFPERVARFAEILRVRLRTVRVDDMGVTVSVGVATFPDDGASTDDVMNAVDQAVVMAAEAGGDQVVSAADAVPEE